MIKPFFFFICTPAPQQKNTKKNLVPTVSHPHKQKQSHAEDEGKTFRDSVILPGEEESSQVSLPVAFPLLG